MGDEAVREAAEDAWREVEALLDEGDADPSRLLQTLRIADELHAQLTDEASLERRAWILDELTLAHARAGDAEASVAAVTQLLEGDWAIDVLPVRLHAVTVVGTWELLPPAACLEFVERAITLGEAALASDEPSFDGAIREQVARLLALAAWPIARDDLERAIGVLRHWVRDYGDVEIDLGEAPPPAATLAYLEGRHALTQSGGVAAAEAYFRAAAEGGDGGAWLELGVVAGWFPGREDDEARALRAALDHQRDPERFAHAGYLLGVLLHYGVGDRDGARAAFGRATTGSGPFAQNAVKELAILSALDGDEQARQQLVSELAGRAFSEFDSDARRQDHRRLARWSRIGYHPLLIAYRARRWRQRRRRDQRKVAETGSAPSEWP